MMKISIEQAINWVKNQKSLEGMVIEDLNDVQVSAADALLLADYGIVIPEQNIYYRDEDIAYDADFDEEEWAEEPLNMSWKEKQTLAEELRKKEASSEEVAVKINIPDSEVRQWVRANYDKMDSILGRFLVDIYKARQMTKD
ncbi:MAG: hypothetical protein GVY26_19750 [Bacteroidetes bacterium]|jgi:sulfur carrier protein ThiS|nr:hypothetical protein [Bacteroidota bacterium]